MTVFLDLSKRITAQLAGVVLVLASGLACVQIGWAQDFELYRPRTPESTEGRPELPDEPEPVTGAEVVLVDELKGLIFVDHPDKVVAGPLDSTGVKINRDGGLALLDTPEFHGIVEPYLGGPVSMRRLNEMAREIVLLYRADDQPVVNVSIPEQDITGGVVQVVVTEGRVGAVQVDTRGWFDPCVLAGKTCISTGDPIYQSMLMEDLRYLNRNPYREVDLRLTPGDAYGETDVIFDVRDRRPISAYLGYEDSGNQSTGLERGIYGLHWGNAFGLDHSTGYQYTASADFFDLEAHTGFYSIPLWNRDELVIYGSYATLHAELPPPFDADGFAWEAAFRYYYDLYPGMCCPRDCLQRRLIFGFDFKRSNSDLRFGQHAVFASIADIAQIVVGYDSTLQDGWGTRALGVDLYVSPGGFSTFNNDADFDVLQPGASAEYIYARAYYERTVGLPWYLSLYGKLTGQAAESNLLASEQLGYGGYNSIRGYDMRLVNGDSGWLLNVELRTDPIYFNPASRCHELQFLAFFDYGDARRHNPPPGVPGAVDLSSVGLGLRYSIHQLLTLRADYGWQLTEAAPGLGLDSRVHLGAVAMF